VDPPPPGATRELGVTAMQLLHFVYACHARMSRACAWTWLGAVFSEVHVICRRRGRLASLDVRLGFPQGFVGDGGCVTLAEEKEPQHVRDCPRSRRKSSAASFQWCRAGTAAGQRWCSGQWGLWRVVCCGRRRHSPRVHCMRRSWKSWDYTITANDEAATTSEAQRGAEGSRPSPQPCKPRIYEARRMAIMATIPRPTSATAATSGTETPPVSGSPRATLAEALPDGLADGGLADGGLADGLADGLAEGVVISAPPETVTLAVISGWMVH
jgi:hypothetical protein